MAAADKPRQPRLRASCDGCFLAKVKCSKARPICTRCLTCGIDCRYSPSSRAGKPKASEQAKNHHNTPQTMTGPPPVTAEGTMYAVNAGMPSMYRLEPDWTTPPNSFDGALSRSESMSSGIAFAGVDNSRPTTMESGMTADIYGPTLPWTPPNDVPNGFAESPLAATFPNTHSRSHSYDMSNHNMGWVGSTSPDVYSFTQISTSPSTATNYASSPTATSMHPLPTRPQSAPINSAGGSCTCFTVCLQSLQALHNASSPSPPPFDLVLSLNRKAVEGCAAMLACTKCMRRSGTHTATMLLATVLGTITTFYKNASQSYFNQEAASDHLDTTTTASTPTILPSTLNVPGLGVSLGAYTVNLEDSRWLELEILARELRKLEEVYSCFREVCSNLSEDPAVSDAMVGYLGQSLGSTMQVVSHRKGDMGF